MLLIQILKTSKEANGAYKGNADYILVVLFGIEKQSICYVTDLVC